MRAASLCLALCATLAAAALAPPAAAVPDAATLERVRAAMVPIEGAVAKDASAGVVVPGLAVVVSTDGYLLTTYDFMRKLRSKSGADINRLTITARIASGAEDASVILSSSESDLLLLKTVALPPETPKVAPMPLATLRKRDPDQPLYLVAPSGNPTAVKIKRFDVYRDPMKAEPLFSSWAGSADALNIHTVQIYWETDTLPGAGGSDAVVVTEAGEFVGLAKADGSGLVPVHAATPITAPARLEALERTLASVQQSLRTLGSWKVEDISPPDGLKLAFTYTPTFDDGDLVPTVFVKAVGVFGKEAESMRSFSDGPVENIAPEAAGLARYELDLSAKYKFVRSPPLSYEALEEVKVEVSVDGKGSDFSTNIAYPKEK